MSDIFDMYQEMIIDHSRSPKNFGELANKSHHAHGHNPLCGDMIHIDLLIHNDVISGIAFNGDGCAISKASASLMTESVKGKHILEVEKLFNAFHSMMTSEQENFSLGKLEALKGVRRFPVRVKCATLCWHTLTAALQKNTEHVTTE